jgi:CheY-like chemotaxis protein
MTTAALRILVVDDHAIVREAVARILAGARRPWPITQAASGDEASSSCARIRST